MREPEVSLILPTQGDRPSLSDALQSALAQDLSQLEIIVVDDSVSGPRLNERAALAPYLSDPRVRVVPSHRGIGCAAAKNVGLRVARGKWICYLDDDNTYLPGKVGAQHKLASGGGSPVVLCGVEFRMGVRRRRKQTDAGVLSGDDLLLRTMPDTNVLFHRRDVGVWWDETLGTVDDACLFQAILHRYDQWEVPNVPDPLAIYHVHDGVRANRGFERFYRGQRCLLCRWSRRYSPEARRVLLLRSLVAFEKYRPGRWLRLMGRGTQLMRAGGVGEWRGVVNAAGVKIPGLRRWLVT